MPHKVNQRRKWLHVLATIIASGTIPAILMIVLSRSVTGSELLRSFGYGLVYSTCIGTLCFITLPRAGPVFACRRFPWNWALLLAVLTGLALIGTLLANAVLAVIGAFPPKEFWSWYANSVRLAMLITFGFGIAGFFYETLSHKLEATTLELRTRELQEERALKLARDAQLSCLESRIHPHFLFNTLNSISALIREDPVRAEQTVGRLAALLRFSLDTNTQRLAPLRQEISIVTDYLEIEKTRFGDRLRYSIEIPGELENLEVPPMSVQTLVENSVKYAVAASRSGGEIRVRARVEDGKALIEVMDDGPGFSKAALVEGHGLETLQGRLSALYGNGAKLDIGRRDGRTVVSMALTA